MPPPQGSRLNAGVTVFISYSHDTPAHSAQVMAFADRLKGEGANVLLDQYDPDPSQGWPLWMEECLDSANLIVIICTETYKRRLKNQETTGVGLGVRWEGNLIYSLIYTEDDPHPSAKFIPVLFEGGLT